MNYKVTLICILFLLVLIPVPASSESSNLEIDVYYNDKLYPGASTPKPLLKIGEPFKLRFEVTCYKRNFLSVMLTSIDDDDFDIIEGPTSNLGDGTRWTTEANETRVFEWTVAPNEEWSGGSAPINFYYQMTNLETKKIITSGKFTAAYVTISNEYYEAPVEPVSEPAGEGTSQSSPGFNAMLSVFGLVAAVVLRKN